MSQDSLELWCDAIWVLHGMEQPYHSVVRRHYFEGEPIAAIARSLEMSDRECLDIAHRGLRQLKDGVFVDN